MAKQKSSALDRARADLQAGRPDLARDRLHGYLFTLHKRGEYSQEVYALLGETYYAMRDFPRAGAAWLLTEHDDAEAQFAIEAFHKRYGTTASNVRDQVCPRAPSELYPPKVQERLLSWNYRYIPYRTGRVTHHSDGTPLEPQTGLRPIEGGCLIVAVLGVLLACIYLYMILRR